MLAKLKELHDKLAAARAAQVAAIKRAEENNYSSSEAEEAYQRADSDVTSLLSQIEEAKRWADRRGAAGGDRIPHAEGIEDSSQRSAFYSQIREACAVADPTYVGEAQRVLTTGATGVSVPTFWEKQLVEKRDAFTYLTTLANIVSVEAGVGAFKVANESALPTVSMVGENPGSDQAASDPTYNANIDVTPKDMLVVTFLSVQGQLRSMPMLDAQLQRQQARAEALKIEQQAISGDGSTNNCTGLQSKIVSGKIVETTAAAFTGFAAVDKIKDVFDIIADQYRGGARTAFVGTSTIMSVIRKLKDSVNHYYWTVGEFNPDLRKYNPGQMLDRPALESAHAVHAVGAAAKPVLMFGDFEYLDIYKWPATGLLVDPYTKRAQLLVGFSRHAAMDVVCRNTDAFSGLRLTA